jgi:hypothetical protein
VSFVETTKANPTEIENNFAAWTRAVMYVILLSLLHPHTHPSNQKKSPVTIFLCVISQKRANGSHPVIGLGLGLGSFLGGGST